MLPSGLLTHGLQVMARQPSNYSATGILIRKASLSQFASKVVPLFHWFSKASAIIIWRKQSTRHVTSREPSENARSMLIMNHRMDGHPSNLSLRCFISGLIPADGLFQHQTAVWMMRPAQATTLHRPKHLQVVCASMLEKAGRAMHQIKQASPHQNGVENL
jgi:hypothetical protein